MTTSNDTASTFEGFSNDYFLDYAIEQFLTKIRSLYPKSQYRHCVKSVQIWSFFWSVFSCIQGEYRKIRTRKNSVFGHFSRSA